MLNELFWLFCLLQEEGSRKRRLPIVSSVVKVKKFCNDGEEEEEEDDYGLRTGSISSSVSVPAKPERRYLRSRWFSAVSRINLMNKKNLKVDIGESCLHFWKWTERKSVSHFYVLCCLALWWVSCLFIPALFPECFQTSYHWSDKANSLFDTAPADIISISITLEQKRMDIFLMWNLPLYVALRIKSILAFQVYNITPHPILYERQVLAKVHQEFVSDF